jgi:predicted site-specific integrase-resolvase
VRRTLTIAAACRILEIDRATLLKWHDLGYIRLIVIGPLGHHIRRVPTTEVERLRPLA